MFVLMSVLIAGNTVTAQEKASPKLRLSYIKHMDGTYEVKALAFTKKGKVIEPCAGAGISFYTDADYTKLFKKFEANDRGQATLLISDAEAKAFYDSSSARYTFYARILEDSKYESQDADVSAMNATIDVTITQEGDSVKLMKASVMIYDEATKKMIPGVKIPLKFSVKRALCLLPVGEDINYTDEQGSVEVTFPNDIPGDKDGNFTAVVKLDEDENYGTVQYEKSIKWGTPSEGENPIALRSLVGARDNAPWFMVIIINAILIGIWGYLCYIVYSLFRINKLGGAK